MVKVAGDDARRFLNGLVTNDMTKVTPADPCFAALLTPQGKIIVDFMIAEAPAEDGGGFFLDCPRALAGTLVEKLNFYKLRAKVICEDLSEVLGVMTIWNGSGDSEYGLSYPDPRLPKLGQRIMLPPHLATEAASDLDQLYAGMLLGNKNYGWARLTFQKNASRWKHWRPQTDGTARRLKLAQDGLAECDRRMEQ